MFVEIAPGVTPKLQVPVALFSIFAYSPTKNVRRDQLYCQGMNSARPDGAGASNQTKAAQRLGISRDTLRYRIKKFGIAG